jgi:hypothetical protein
LKATSARGGGNGHVTWKFNSSGGKWRWETADILRALFAQSDGWLELAVVGTVATLIPTIRVVDPEIILLDLTLSLRDPLGFISRKRDGTFSAPVRPVR